MSGSARGGAVEDDPDVGAARQRILAAAHALVSSRGWHAASSIAVAQEADVSKALVHYHFKTKSTLLLGVIAWCRTQIQKRAQQAQTHMSAASAVDVMIAWLEHEASAGDLRVITALTFARDREVRARATEVLGTYRAAVTSCTDDVLHTLELFPRVPVATIAELLATTTLGMAAEGRASKATLEAQWLCVLTLTEA